VDHPPVTRTTDLVAILVLLAGAEQQGLLGVEDVDLLDSVLESLSRAKEEGGLTLAEFAGTKTRLAGLLVDGINDDAILTGGQNSDVDLTYDDFLNIGDVRFGVGQGDQPLLSGLSLDVEDIGKFLTGTKVESLLFGQDEGVDGLDYVFVNAGQISAGLTYKVFFTGLTKDAIGILKFLHAAKTEGLQRFNDAGLDYLGNFDFYARNVGSGTEKELETVLEKGTLTP
jgi:hypothetical protein